MKEKKPMPTRTAKHRFLLLPLLMIYMELIIRLVAGGRFFDIDLLAVVGYGAVLGTMLGALCMLGSERANARAMLIVQCCLSVWYITQVVYHSFFGKFMILYSIFAGGADQVIASGLVENTVGAILGCWWTFPVFALPIVAVVFYCKYFALPRLKLKGATGLLLGGIGAYLLLFAGGMLIPSLREVHTDAFNKEQSVKSFGLLRSELMDVRCNVFGLGGDGEIELPEQPDTPVVSKPQITYNVTDIDFAALAAGEEDEEIAELHRYFQLRSPSAQNEYTGMFAGYNLVQITAEGFSPYAIDPELTPTLYKMKTEGFDFTNFYTPIWEVSTFDGEYTATTGLIPKSGVWTYHLAGKENVLFPYTMPQQFLNAGLSKVRAYHNHNYAYYHRDVSHANLGFEYKGVGNGLKLAHPNVWPESDLEMMQSTAGEFAGEERFLTYYMTVSGHLEYSFDGNSMAYKNRKEVEHLPYSEAVRAYYACNLELEKAMNDLIASLSAAGTLDKTVFVITPDHYPYGLEDKTEENMYHYFDEIAGHPIDPDFELYKSCLLIWSPSMQQPVTVEKYCSSLDIIPTLNNLFGFTYDSRLLMGSDILSDSEALVIFLDRSFITEKGTYRADDDVFTPFAGQTADEAYIDRIKTEVRNRFKVSARMIETNYYALVTEREHLYSK